MKQATAIIYARVSTPGQAEEGVSLENQVQRGHQMAAELGAFVRKVFSDEGLSGRSDRRPAFQDALAYCAAFQVDYFIVWSTSRFARNKIDAAVNKRELRRGGTKIVYISNKIDSDTDEGWLMEGVLELMDEQLSRQIRKDTVASMMKNASAGFHNGGRCPFGFKVVEVGHRKKLQIDIAEAAIVREIFRRYIEGMGTKALAITLNESGVLRRGSKWSKNTLANLLKNWAYAGYVVFNRTDHEGKERPESDWIKTKAHEAIIPEEDFVNTQTMMASRSHEGSGGNVRSNALFTGMIKCGACRAPMFTESATGNGGRYSYYICSEKVKGAGCSSKRLRIDLADEALRDAILGEILTRERILNIMEAVHEKAGTWVKARQEERAAMVSQLRGFESRRKNLYDLLELHGKDTPNLGDITTRLRELNAQINTLQKKLDELEAAPAPKMPVDGLEAEDMAQAFADLIIHSDPAKVRTFFAGFVSEVIADGHELKVHYAPERVLRGSNPHSVHSACMWLPALALLRTEILNVSMRPRLHRVF